MGWHPYQSCFDQTMRWAKRQPKGSFDTALSPQEFYAKLMKDILFKSIPKNGNVLLLDLASTPATARIVLTLETEWVRCGRPTVFVESKRVAQILQNAKYSIGDAIEEYKDAIFKNDVAYCVAFEESTTIDNLNIPPFLFGFMNCVTNPLLLDLGGNTAINHAFCCTYKKGDCDSVSLSAPCDPESISAQINFNDYEPIPEKHDYDFHGEILERRHSQTISNLLSLALKLNFYVRAFPDCLREGIPAAMGRKQSGQHLSVLKKSIFVLPRFKDSPISHFRSGHFRCLRNDKFKRNEDGSIRVVYVNPCLVGEKVDPKTVD